MEPDGRAFKEKRTFSGSKLDFLCVRWIEWERPLKPTAAMQRASQPALAEPEDEVQLLQCFWGGVYLETPS